MHRSDHRIPAGPAARAAHAAPILATAIAACLVAAPASAIAAGGDTGPPRWTTTSPEDAFAAAVAIGPDGTTFSSRSTAIGDRMIITEAVDGGGELLWTSCFAGPNGDAVASTIVVTGDEILVGGWARDGLETDAVLLTYIAGGKLVREDRIASGGQFAFPDVHVAAAADGRRALATLSLDGAGVVRLQSWDAEGDAEFAREWMFDGFGQIGDLMFLDDGDLLMSTTTRIGDNAGYIVRRIDPAGADVWETTLIGETNFVASDLHLAPHADGTVTVAGTPELTGGILVTQVARLDQDGNILWDIVRPDDGGGFNLAADLVAATAPGQEGSAWLAFSGSEQRVERIGPDGTVEQSTVLTAPGTLLRLVELAADADGRVVAIATQRGPQALVPNDVRLLQLDADGLVTWESVYIGAGGEADFVGGVATGPGRTIAAAVSSQSNESANVNGVVLHFDLAACSGD
ncbi:MAG: hypothetical protein AB8G96_10425, partial [Phycisphaerales bacterium]